MNMSHVPTRSQSELLTHRHPAQATSAVTPRFFTRFRGPSLAATVAILELARKIEPGVGAAVHWYRYVPIVELGNFSPQQLVAQGEGESVLTFLKSIYRGERG